MAKTPKTDTLALSEKLKEYYRVFDKAIASMEKQADVIEDMSNRLNTAKDALRKVNNILKASECVDHAHLVKEVSTIIEAELEELSKEYYKA